MQASLLLTQPTFVAFSFLSPFHLKNTYYIFKNSESAEFKELALMADQIWPPDKSWTFYATFFLLATPTRPNRPEPNNHTAAGTGTSDGRSAEIVTLSI